MTFQDFSARTHAVIGNPDLLARMKDQLIAYGAASAQDIDPADRASFLAELGL